MQKTTAEALLDRSTGTLRYLLTLKQTRFVNPEASAQPSSAMAGQNDDGDSHNNRTIAVFGVKMWKLVADDVKTFLSGIYRSAFML